MGDIQRVLSLGASVQSSTLLLMSCRGELPRLDAAVFADTQYEPPAVYEHLAWLETEAARDGEWSWDTPARIYALVSRSEVRDLGDGRTDYQQTYAAPDLAAEVVRLQALVQSLTARVAAQAELLARAAERQENGR